MSPWCKLIADPSLSGVKRDLVRRVMMVDPQFDLLPEPKPAQGAYHPELRDQNKLDLHRGAG